MIELHQKGTVDLSMAGRVHEILIDYPIVHFHCAELSLIHLASRVPGRRLVYTHRGGMANYRLKQRLRYTIAGHLVLNCPSVGFQKYT